MGVFITLLLVISLSLTSGRNIQVAQIYQVDPESNETLGLLSEKFYAHQDLWPLIFWTNSKILRSKIAYSRDSVISLYSDLIIPPASDCVIYMGQSCLQIVELLQMQHDDDVDNEEYRKVKIKQDLNLPKDAKIEILRDIGKNGRMLTSCQADFTIQLMFLLPDSEFHLKEWTASIDQEPHTLSIQVINDTPDPLINFRSQLFEGQLEKLPLSIASKANDIFFVTQTDSQSIEQTSGYLTFSVKSLDLDPFVIGWIDQKEEEFLLKMTVNMPSTGTLRDFLMTQYVDLKQGWNFIKLNNRYAAKIQVSGTTHIHVIVRLLLDSQKEISDGAYHKIFPITSATRALDGWDDFRIKQWDAYETEWQNWMFKAITIDSITAYIISNKVFGQVLTAISSTQVQGKILHASTHPEAKAQLWFVKHQADRFDHTFTICNVLYENSCLSNEGSDLNDYPWILDPSGPSFPNINNKRFLLQQIATQAPTKITNTNIIISKWFWQRTVMGLFELSAGSFVQQRQVALNGLKQHWKFILEGQDQNGSNYYRIQNIETNYYLESSQAPDLVQNPFVDQNTNQFWYVIADTSIHNLGFKIQNQGLGCFITSPIESLEIPRIYPKDPNHPFTCRERGSIPPEYISGTNPTDPDHFQRFRFIPTSGIGLIHL